MLESSYLKAQFEKEYDRAEWSKILREIFNATLLAKPKNLDLKRNEWGATGFELGSFETLEGRQVGIFEIDVPHKAKLQHNRKGLRDLLKNEVYRDQVDAALLVFKQDKKWRFSYVSQIRVYNKETGKRELKVTEPKRYTYLMGEGERCLTAAKQFAKIQMDTNLFGKGVTLETLHNAFSVEKMSKEFFDEYRRQYGLFTAFLTGYDETNKEKNPASGFLRSAFGNDTKAARDFVKKTLGRIVFLYFLEKKGWLGVPRGEKWGKGDDNFLSNLYRDCRQKGNFYSDVLVPLFFRTLNRERTDSLFDIRPDVFTNPAYSTVKVPYLNGGLFEEDGSGTTLLTFPQHLFKGLFDFFDQYNFTVYEDSPDEHTVAVDPEMLGHIFENLLEDNKDKGTYYTPKEIVHYMCQESLIEYLCTKLEGSAERSDIERFIKHQEAGGVAGYSEEILQALFDVKICDPAIGSGAFPMGILTEILHAVETLYYLSPDVSEKVWGISDWQPAKVKTEIIQNSIYGVDIEQGAVDIARLRFWLSLVVDEENPQPLPNLDYKIVVGNSLVSKFDEQVIEIDWNLTIKGAVNDVVKKIQKQQEVVHSKLKSLFEKQQAYFDFDGDKNQLKEEIRQLKIEVLIEQIQLNIERNNLNTTQKSLFDESDKNKKKAVDNLTLKFALEAAIIKLNRLKNRFGAPVNFFDWKLDFPEIMNGQVSKSEIGFDIVIGNPPYVKVQNIPKDLSIWYKNNYLSATDKYDIYVLFIENSLNLLKKRGLVSFINPHRFLITKYGEGLRELLLTKRAIKKAIYFGVKQIFETATTYTGIFLLKENSEYLEYSIPDTKDLGELRYNRKNYDEDFNFNFSLDDTSNSIIDKILVHKKVNEIFDGVFQGIIPMGDDIQVFKGEIIGAFFHGYSTALNSEIVIEREIVKPILKGENIQRYKPCQTNTYIFYPHYIDAKGRTKPMEEETLSKNFPRAYDYILNFKSTLIEKKTKYKTNAKYWYSLHRSREQYIFENEKIITPQLQNKPSFTIDKNKFYADAGGYMILNKKPINCGLAPYLGIFNSKVFYYFIRKTSTPYNNDYYYFKTNYIEPFGIPPFSEKSAGILSKAVEEITSRKAIGEETIQYENEIDLIVYRLYGLTYDEASIIEGNTEWMSREDYEKL